MKALSEQYVWAVQEWCSATKGWETHRFTTVTTWTNDKSLARRKAIMGTPALAKTRFKCVLRHIEGVPAGMELSPEPVQGKGWPSWRVPDLYGEYRKV